MPTTQRMHTSRKALESSPSLLVRSTIFGLILGHLGANYILELELDEEGTRISLTIVDTPGFGDQIDNEARYDTHLSRLNGIVADQT